VPATAPPQPPSLWRHPDFLKLWGGQSVSELGSAVSLVAFPLVAVVLLHASTLQVGLLSAAQTAPFLLVALPAGLIVDRIAKRRLMIACDVGRMLVFGSVPVAAAFGALTLGQLFAVALAAGFGTVFFDVAYQSYVPGLIGRAELPDGNGKLAATQSFAQVAGPGLGGALYGLLRAGAVTADALSYAVSAAALLAIRAREPQQASRPAGQDAPRLRTELLAGVMFIVRQPILRKIAACTATANLFGSMAYALEVVFIIRVLHVRPEFTGLLLAAGSIGGVTAGIASGALTRLIGSARIIWVSLLGFGVIGVLLPLAEPGWRLALVPVGLFGTTFSGVLYNIGQLSFRQSICPPELLGRMNAAIRWIVWGTLPLGGVIGGVLGATAGIRPTLWIGVTGCWLGGLWVLASPLRTMRDIPAAGDAGPVDTPPPPPGLLEAT
jgi:predicted MFS family arabinose efflux permease